LPPTVTDCTEYRQLFFPTRKINLTSSPRTTGYIIKGKGKGMSTCYSAAYEKTREQQCLTILEVQLIGMS